MTKKPNTELIPASKFLPTEEQEYVTDLDYARTNIYSAIENAQKGLESISNIADCSQHPRAYEVTAQYLKTIAGLNKDLISISKDKKHVKETGPVENKSGGHITQNLFVGSTKELGEVLKAAKNKK